MNTAVAALRNVFMDRLCKNGSEKTFAAFGTLGREKWPCGPSLHNYRELAVTIPSPASEVTDGRPRAG
jgi:hypothetical protein